MINYNFDDESIKKRSFLKDLKAANYEIDKETGEATFSHKYQYQGTLEFYFETGMEGMASIVHDLRGLKLEKSWNSVTLKNDGEIEECKSLEWSVFLKGGEYLKVFSEDGSTLWEGLLFNDTEAIKKGSYCYHFLPLEINLKDWITWCSKEYSVIVFTNTPVLAEDLKYQKEKVGSK